MLNSQTDLGKTAKSSKKFAKAAKINCIFAAGLFYAEPSSKRKWTYSALTMLSSFTIVIVVSIYLPEDIILFVEAATIVAIATILCGLTYAVSFLDLWRIFNK